jgi:hypothetical protein
MNKSAFISDLIFTLFISWLFTLCIFRYVGAPLLTALILSVFCGVLCTCALGAFWQNKRKTVLLKRSETAVKEKLDLHLCLLTPPRALDMFYRVFLQTEQFENVQKQGKNRLITKQQLYFFYFRFTPITADDVATIARVFTTKEKVLVCLQLEDAAFQLCHRLGITAQTGEWAYLFLKKHDALPKTFLGDTLKENKRKRTLRLCLAKNNARRFFVGALFILALSLITPFPLYYLLFASLLLITALCIRIFGYS